MINVRPDSVEKSALESSAVLSVFACIICPPSK
jgi:hypothetical protein